MREGGGEGRKEAGRGRLDPRSQHWPDGEAGWGGGGGREKKRIQIQQYGCTHQIRLGFGSSQAKHEGEAILWADREPPDSSPFKHPHFSSARGWGRGRGPRSVSGQGDARGGGIF